MRSGRKVGQMQLMDNYMLDEDQEDDEEDEEIDEDDEEDDEDDEEYDEEDEYYVDDDDLADDNSEENEHKELMKLSGLSISNRSDVLVNRKRPKLLHTKRARRRQSRSSSVISDQMASRFSMLTPQSLLSDSSRSCSRTANISSGRTSAASGDFLASITGTSGSVGHLVGSNKLSNVAKGSTSDVTNTATPIAGTSANATGTNDSSTTPAGKAKQFTRQLSRQLSKQLLRLNSSNKLPVSGLSKTEANDTNKPSPDSTASQSKGNSLYGDLKTHKSGVKTGSPSIDLRQSELISSSNLVEEEQLRKRRAAQGRFASFSITPRGSIGWLFDKSQRTRSASRAELRDLERLAALEAYGAYGSNSPVSSVGLGSGKQGNLLSKVRRTSAAVRHWMSNSLGKTDNFQDLINLRECVPPMYYNTKGMAKSIKVSFFFIFCSYLFYLLQQ